MCKNEPNKNVTIVKLSNAILGASLSALATGASALSLGASHGTVVLGAPVDLVFDVQPDSGSDIEASCVRVRLMSGDTAVPDSKVQVTPVPAAGGRSPAVRVRAYITADEPVVTATVSAGCSGGVTRRYTFLAQLPEAVAAASPSGPVDIGRLAGAGASAAGASAGAAQGMGGRGPRAAASGAAPSPAPRAGRQAAAAAPSAPRPPSRAPKPAPTAAASPAAERARLVMEPLDVWLDGPLPLRQSPELADTGGTASPEQRARAAALWKALNTPVEDVQRAAGQAAQLEGAVATERARAASERAAAADLRQRLDDAESDRFPSVVVYALVGLVVALALLAAWLWGRARRAAASAWTEAVAASSQPREPGGEPLAPESSAQATRPQAEAPAERPKRQPVMPSRASASAARVPPVPAEPPAPLPAAAPAARDSFHLPAFADSLSGAVLVEGPVMTRNAPLVPGRAPAPAPAAPAPAPFMAPAPMAAPAPAAVPRMAGPQPEDLFDIQQQAEFFVSVGEHDQAIAVLRQHIAAHGDTSAFAYLELLRLYHTLGRVEGFHQLREQFCAQFNVSVPEFGNFHRSGKTLQGFPDALAAIEAEWSSPAVLGVIEGFLFRQADAPKAAQFDLAAFDDLLLLLAIAQTTPASARGPAPPRPRTTPNEIPADEVQAAAAPVRAASAEPEEELRSFDTLSAGLTWESLPAPLPRAPSTAPSPLHEDPDAMLDIDLSEPPHLTLSDLPPVPVTPPPAPGQSVGFGMDEKMELRLELDEFDRKNRTPKG
ncbi:Tfp pilus assembly protein FimV [Paracidovorax citrulli]|uniref:Uncharacterized protein n=2 Tax=Paracidovorax citrulli TaxID=80869 RepID=A1TRQ0_PARC0|nr:hypothetical protein Aave_3072 [Paracidovorax citrulli AAC00-1]ATG94244.1 hypothetical protein CQB05_09515 [Paracidovorax citrulli]PVY63068.1 Tfp pilus assembly protein FimV [Paracidovorax citrulli]QCX12633.1 hypothetical protein APS58_3921 [Paracidovorax citrulli]REG67949.1 Tfp pilus assembly protein FimV [Paracidovorax citrulli]